MKDAFKLLQECIKSNESRNIEQPHSKGLFVMKHVLDRDWLSHDQTFQYSRKMYQQKLST